MGYPPETKERLARRPAAAWELLRNGADTESVRRQFRYQSLSALRQAVDRYRRTLDDAAERTRSAGKVTVQPRPDAGSRLILSRCPIDRAGWSPGDQISWHVHDNEILLYREEGTHLDPDPNDVEAMAYRLVRIDRMEVSEAAARLGLSRSTLHRRVQGYARARPWLRTTLHPRRADAVSGVVRVTTRGGKPTLILTTPVGRQAWNAGDTVEWRFLEGSRGLRLARVESTKKMP